MQTTTRTNNHPSRVLPLPFGRERQLGSNDKDRTSENVAGFWHEKNGWYRCYNLETMLCTIWSLGRKRRERTFELCLGPPAALNSEGHWPARHCLRVTDCCGQVRRAHFLAPSKGE